MVKGGFVYFLKTGCFEEIECWYLGSFKKCLGELLLKWSIFLLPQGRFKVVYGVFRWLSRSLSSPLGKYLYNLWVFFGGFQGIILFFLMEFFYRGLGSLQEYFKAFLGSFCKPRREVLVPKGSIGSFEVFFFSHPQNILEPLLKKSAVY